MRLFPFDVNYIFYESKEMLICLMHQTEAVMREFLGKTGCHTHETNLGDSPLTSLDMSGKQEMSHLVRPQLWPNMMMYT